MCPGHASVHSDSGSRAWGSGCRARCVEQQSCPRLRFDVEQQQQSSSNFYTASCPIHVSRPTGKFSGSGWHTDVDAPAAQAEGGT